MDKQHFFGLMGSGVGRGGPLPDISKPPPSSNGKGLFYGVDMDHSPNRYGEEIKEERRVGSVTWEDDRTSGRANNRRDEAGRGWNKDSHREERHREEHRSHQRDYDTPREGNSRRRGDGQFGDDRRGGERRDERRDDRRGFHDGKQRERRPEGQRGGRPRYSSRGQGRRDADPPDYRGGNHRDRGSANRNFGGFGADSSGAFDVAPPSFGQFTSPLEDVHGVPDFGGREAQGFKSNDGRNDYDRDSESTEGYENRGRRGWGGGRRGRGAGRGPEPSFGMWRGSLEIQTGGNTDEDYSKRKCFNCDKEGHISRNCPKKRRGDDDDSSSVGHGERRPFIGVCYNCGGPDHLSRDCTQPRKEPIPPRRLIQCYNCQEEGHLSRNCPKKDINENAENIDQRSIPHGVFDTITESRMGFAQATPFPTGFSIGRVLPSGDIVDEEEHESDHHQGNVGQFGAWEISADNTPQIHSLESGFAHLDCSVQVEKKADQVETGLLVQVETGLKDEENYALGFTENDRSVTVTADSTASESQVDNFVKHDILPASHVAKILDLERLLRRGDDAEYRVDGPCKCSNKGVFEACTCKKKVVVFVNRRITVECIKIQLAMYGITAATVHCAMTSYDRNYNLESFKNGRSKLMIMMASEAASSASYLKDIDWLVNLNLPLNIEEYKARIEMVRRDGHLLRVTSFYDRLMDNLLAQDLVQVLNNAKQPVPEWLTSDMEIGLESYLEDEDDKSTDEDG